MSASDSDSSASDALKGYRLVFLQQSPINVGFYQRQGASILSLSETSESDRNETFEIWWRNEVARARRDGVVLLVMKTHFDEMQLRKKLELLEEDEWYQGQGRWPGRVRFLPWANLYKTICDGETLEDEWGETIERGDDAWRVYSESVAE